MLDIQTGVEMDSEAVLYDPATVALLEGLNEACQVAMDGAVFCQAHRFRDPDAEEEVEGEGEKVKEDNDPRAVAFISGVGAVAIQTIVGETVLSAKSLSIDLTRIESEDPHIGRPLPVVQNGMQQSDTLGLELCREAEEGVNGIILTMHSVLGGLRIDVNPAPDGVVSHSSNSAWADLDWGGPGGQTERIDNGKQILQDIIARMTVMYRLIIARDVRLLTGGDEVRDEVEAMVQECLREAGVV